MKITDVPCSCGCGWSGTTSDCDPDVSGSARLGTLGCPVCLTPVTCNDPLPIIFTIKSVEITRDLNEFFDSQPPPTVTITFQAPRKFRYEHLLQAVDKRIKITILEEETVKTDLLTDAEIEVVYILANAWNHFLQLPVSHGDDVNEFRTAIHAAQDKVLARPGRRQINKEK